VTESRNPTDAPYCIEFHDVVAGYKDFMILNNLSFSVRAASRFSSDRTVQANPLY
jgi:hypothetical protein